MKTKRFKFKHNTKHLDSFYLGSSQDVRKRTGLVLDCYGRRQCLNISTPLKSLLVLLGVVVPVVIPLPLMVWVASKIKPIIINLRLD